MPTYTYKCEECGKVQDHVQTVAEREEPVECECGGKQQYDFGLTIADVHEFGEMRMQWSEALAVQPEDVKKTMEEDRKIGSTAAAYHPDGRLGFTSLQQKRRYMRDRGFIDRNSYV